MIIYIFFKYDHNLYFFVVCNFSNFYTVQLFSIQKTPQV